MPTNSPRSAEAAASRIRLLILDVDGVLTDGGLYYDGTGCIMKRFNAQDGLGIKTAQAEGIIVAVISGLNHPPVECRVRELGIEDYYPGHHRKVPCMEEICRRHGISIEETAYLGDDWVDIGPMRLAGLPMAVSNAQPEVLEIASYVTERRGGDGAVREAVSFILKAQGKLEKALASWENE